MVAADGRGNGYTLAAGARSAQRDTRRSKAERRSGVSGRNDDAQRKAAPSPTSRSPMQAGIGPVADRGTYAVQVTSERSAAEADTSFRALRAKFPNQLGGREPIVRRTDVPLRQWKRRLECAAHCRLQAATASFKEIESTLDHRSGDCRCSSSKLLIPPR